jgi:ribosomal protein S8
MEFILSFIGNSIISSIESWLIKELLMVVGIIIAIIIGIVLLFKGIFWIFGDHSESSKESGESTKSHSHSPALIVSILFLMGTTSYYYIKYSKAETKLETYVSEMGKLNETIKSLKNTTEELIKINSDNTTVIYKLKKERDSQLESIDRVNAENKIIYDKAAELERLLNNVDPAKNGAVSPILKETIDLIQKESK